MTALPTAPPMVVDFLRLDDLFVEAGGLVVADRIAELDELGVAHLGHRLAGEGAGGHTLGRRAQTAKVMVEGAVALGCGVEARHVLAQFLEYFREDLVLSLQHAHAVVRFWTEIRVRLLVDNRLFDRLSSFCEPLLVE